MPPPPPSSPHRLPCVVSSQGHWSELCSSRGRIDSFQPFRCSLRFCDGGTTTRVPPLTAESPCVVPSRILAASPVAGGVPDTSRCSPGGAAFSFAEWRSLSWLFGSVGCSAECVCIPGVWSRRCLACMGRRAEAQHAGELRAVAHQRAFVLSSLRPLGVRARCASAAVQGLEQRRRCARGGLLTAGGPRRRRASSPGR